MRQLVILVSVAMEDARVMIGALADPEALLVFGTIVTATSWARRRRESERSASSSAYITPFGLVKQTSLPRDVVERAVERLKEAGLLEVFADDERGYESWRINEASLAAVTR